MRLYRGVKNPYRAELVHTVHTTPRSGTDFIDCPATALLYAQGSRGVLVVVDISVEDDEAMGQPGSPRTLARPPSELVHDSGPLRRRHRPPRPPRPPSFRPRTSGRGSVSSGFATRRERPRPTRFVPSSKRTYESDESGLSVRSSLRDPSSSIGSVLASRGGSVLPSITAISTQLPRSPSRRRLATWSRIRATYITTERSQRAYRSRPASSRARAAIS